MTPLLSGLLSFFLSLALALSFLRLDTTTLTSHSSLWWDSLCASVCESVRLASDAVRQEFKGFSLSFSVSLPWTLYKRFYAAFGLFCALFAAGEESKACLSHAKWTVSYSWRVVLEGFTQRRNTSEYAGISLCPAPCWSKLCVRHVRQKKKRK